MKLATAIKELEDGLADKWCPWSPKMKASIDLGIEAMKRCQEFRKYTTPKVYMPLPGETPEN